MRIGRRRLALWQQLALGGAALLSLGLIAVAVAIVLAATMGPRSCFQESIEERPSPTGDYTAVTATLICGSTEGGYREVRLRRTRDGETYELAQFRGRTADLVVDWQGPRTLSIVDRSQDGRLTQHPLEQLDDVRISYR